MKRHPLIYILVCAATVAYVLVANARGFVPFTSSAGRAASGGSGGHSSGTAGSFHK